MEMSEIKGERHLLDSPPRPDIVRPEWMELGTSVKETMALIEQKCLSMSFCRPCPPYSWPVEQLGKSYRDQRLVSFDDQSSSSNDTIEILSQEISRLLVTAQKKLDRIPSDQDTKQNQIIRKNLQQQLAMQLSTITHNFREQQKRYLIGLHS